MSETPTDDPVRINAAEHLILIARDLRAAGDVPLVLLDADGVGPANVTLAGELETIALELDFDRVITRARTDGDARA